MSQYGIPYQGSKAKICDQVCAIFPKAENFYDLFGGGFSVTHCMLEKRKKDFKYFHFNEIRQGVCGLIKGAIAGEYNYNKYLPPWVSREEFFAKKEVDSMIKIIWSFGNDGKTYLFGKDIEQDKRSMHMAVVFNEFDDYAKKVFGMEKFRDGLSIIDKRLFLKSRIRLLNMKRLDLQQLQQLEQLNFYNGSYESVEIRKDSVIYCDIPYIGTAKYDNNNSFNHKKFFDWASEQDNPLFVSEYDVADKRFRLVKTIKKRSLFSSNKAMNEKTEKIYANKIAFEMLMSKK